MASKEGDYIVRGDDGKLYRVSRDQLFAHPLSADDPAHRHAKDLHALAEKSKGTHPMVCIIATRDQPGGHGGAHKGGGKA